MKILSYNMHKGFSALHSNLVLSSMKEAIASVGADLVFLQEVVGQHETHQEKHAPHWPEEGQLEFLADSLWPHFAYGKNAVYPVGHHGNAILSKYPILSWQNTDISAHRWEQRGLLQAVVAPPGKKSFCCLCTHLALTEWHRKKQMKRLMQCVVSSLPQDMPVIMAGDFNDWRGTVSRTLEAELSLVEAHRQLSGRYARTFPSFLPLLQLDRIHLRGFQPTMSRVLNENPWRTLSDHRPLLVEVSDNF